MPCPPFRSPYARYRLIARQTPTGRGGMIWQTKILSATRPKSNRPRNRQRPHPSRRTPRPRAAHPSRIRPAVSRRAEGPAARRRVRLRSRASPQPIRAHGMRPKPRLGHRLSRHALPVWPSRAAGPATRTPRIRGPELRQVATAMRSAVRGSRPAAHRATADLPTRVTLPTASASSIRRRPTPCRAAAAAWSVRAADHPAGIREPGAAAGIAAATARRASRGHGLPAVSRAASRTGQPAEAHPAAVRRAAVTPRGHREARTGPAATISRVPSNLSPARTADSPTTPPPQPPGPARLRRARGPRLLRLRPSRKSSSQPTLPCANWPTKCTAAPSTSSRR